MSSRMNHRSAAARTARAAKLAVVTLALAATAACNSLLDVDNPASVTEEALGDPTLVPALAAAALQTLQCGVVNFVGTAGMLSGEYLSANGFVHANACDSAARSPSCVIGVVSSTRAA